MTREESIALWLQGKTVWNEWANGMLAERKALEDAGEWEAEKDFLDHLEGRNKKTKDWLNKADVDFSNLWLRAIDQPEKVVKEKGDFSKNRKSVFLEKGDVNFSQYEFPYRVDFRNTVFGTYSGFNGSRFNGDANFQGSIFNDDANFSESEFLDGANFGDSKFMAISSFMDSTIQGLADFTCVNFKRGAMFSGFRCCSNIHFNGATFLKYVDFNGSTFYNDVDFSGSTFDCHTNFIGSTFAGEANFSDYANYKPHLLKLSSNFFHVYKACTFTSFANFSFVHFKKLVTFKAAKFESTANFASITSDKSFNLLQTDFTLVPDFTEAAFHAPPVLDEIEIAEPLIKRAWRWCGKENEPRSSYLYNNKIANNLTDTRKYRALAKMAAEAKDYQNEMKFFADEQRCRRFWHDKPFGKGAGRFWFGLAYEKVSDFGRSFWRPLVGWLSSTVIFAGLYALTSHGKISDWFDPVYISIRHGLIFSGLTRSEHWDSAITALYATTKGDKSTIDISNTAASLMLAQPIISAVFIFLFLLAVRNQFKIR